jgi:site-specific recombinase XerD
MDFLRAFRMFIEHHRTTTIVYEKRAEKTLQAYEVRYSRVNEFLISKNLVRIKCQDFNIKLAKEFFRYLSADLSNNYAVRNVDLCRAVLEYCASNEIIKFNPLAALKLKKSGPDKPTHLTPDEVKMVEDYQSKNASVEKARKMFLFQCYTGLDYGDLVSVTRDNIMIYKDREFIIKAREKTGIEACVPYHPKARMIMESFGGSIPKFSNCKYNLNIKRLMIKIGISKRVTTHVGRKTYAMGKLNQESYSIEAVSKMIGHKSIKTTETYYAQVSIDLVCREMDRKELSPAA